MPEEKSSSISISNSQLSGAQIGQAGRNLNQTQEVHQGISESPIEREDVLGVLTEFEALVRISHLPEAQKTKAVSYVEAAKTAAQENEPDKSYAASSLQRATKILKDASATVEAGQGLWEKAQNIVTKILPWFGVAKSFFGF